MSHLGRSPFPEHKSHLKSTNFSTAQVVSKSRYTSLKQKSHLKVLCKFCVIGLSRRCSLTQLNKQIQAIQENLLPSPVPVSGVLPLLFHLRILGLFLQTEKEVLSPVSNKTQTLSRRSDLPSSVPVSGISPYLCGNLPLLRKRSRSQKIWNLIQSSFPSLTSETTCSVTTAAV